MSICLEYLKVDKGFLLSDAWVDSPERALLVLVTALSSFQQILFMKIYLTRPLVAINSYYCVAR